MGPPASYRVSRVRYYSGATRLVSDFVYGSFTLFAWLFQNHSTIFLNTFWWSATPKNKSFGLASFPFARRYLGNRCFFLLLELLRCFSSPRFLLSDYLFHLRMPVYYYRRVPPFGYLRISGYLLLPAAFRSLSRPSSAPSAKASALCSFSLDLLLAIFPLYCVMLPSFISHIPEYAPSSFSRIPCLKKKYLRSFMLSFRLLALTTF